jgi:ribonuclease H2 subunit C
MRVSKRYWNPRQSVLSKHLSRSTTVDENNQEDSAVSSNSTTTTTTALTKVPTAYLRGRKLLAKRLPLPAGYSGHLLQKTNKIVPVKPKIHVPRHNEEEEDEEEDEEEEIPVEVKVVEEKGRFEEILVWQHESVPAEEEDVYIKGLGEWMSWAEKVSAAPIYCEREDLRELTG